jgi:nitrogen regulatory protein PII-like uncharacterized protein
MKLQLKEKMMISDKKLQRLNQALFRVLGTPFFNAFYDRLKSDDFSYRSITENPDTLVNVRDKLDDATKDAVESFTFHVEELLDDVFDIIVEDVAYEHDIGRTQEQKDELEEGKSL